MFRVNRFTLISHSLLCVQANVNFTVHHWKPKNVTSKMIGGPLNSQMSESASNPPPPCHEVQKSIQDQENLSKMYGNEIDVNQEKVISLLKKMIVRSHFHCQQAFIAGGVASGQIRDGMKHSAFTAGEDGVAASFSSLELPDEFSKGPMKAFLNTLLDSLESFLPAFYKLTPSKLPRGQIVSDTSSFLVRCVFPSLFGFCWSKEAAISYAKNLVTWFEELQRENPSFVEGFQRRWMFQAIYGFVQCLNLRPFIESTVTPVLYKFVECDMDDPLSKPEFLLKLTAELLERIHENYYLLPDVLNVFYGDMFQLLPEEHKKIVVIDLFYDIIIAPCMSNPILASTCDVMLPEQDFAGFNIVYTIFELKFGRECKNEDPRLKQLESMPEFQQFNPMSVLDDIVEAKARMKLPSMVEFCDIVQCAHQPLLFTTHSIAVLFRFVASLQHTGKELLPKSIDRSISTVFQNSLADQLEVLPDLLFWFPCFSLTYLKVAPPVFAKEHTQSPIYRLLSSPHIQIEPGRDKLLEAIDDAKTYVNAMTHPELKTEVQWILYTNQGNEEKLMSGVLEEISKKAVLLEQKRNRAIRLDIYAKSLDDQASNLPRGPARSMALSLFPAFREQYPGEMVSLDYINSAVQRVCEFTGKAYNTIGRHLIELIMVHAFPSWKRESGPPQDAVEKAGDPTIDTLRSMITRPMECSSYFSTAQRLAKDLMFLLAYGDIAGVPNPLKSIYQPPFYKSVEKLALEIQNVCDGTPPECLKLVLTPDEIKALSAFVATFA